MTDWEVEVQQAMEQLRRCQTNLRFRTRAAAEYVRRRYPREDWSDATIAAFQVQLERDVDQGDRDAIELQEELLNRAIRHAVENPRWL
jgi:hypothetical protein